MKELNFDWLLNGSCLLSDVTPRQICIVIRHWGMPDTVYKWLREHPADRVQKLFADRKFD